ncbi:hypothetical protein Q7S_08765 [Rahnella aquatilis HX2]|nr:hypothetical protein Q7S_08765 [Rahnella aquatilis HX2]
MSEPISGLTVTGTLAGAGLFGWFSGLDYGVVFGAFAGAVFYVTSAADLSNWRKVSYFTVSFLAGIFGAGVAGAKLSKYLDYTDKPLDALGAVIISALAVQLLTFASNRAKNPTSLIDRWRGQSGNK